jgi:hypothetical protein
MAETTKKTTTRKKTSASAAAPSGIAEKRSSKNVTAIRSVSRDDIAALAHKYWAERGYQHGHDAEDWFRAEQELLGKAS